MRSWLTIKILVLWFCGFGAGRMYLAGLRMGLKVRVMRVTRLRPKAGDLVHVEFRKPVSPAQLRRMHDCLAKAYQGVDFTCSVPAFVCFHEYPEGALREPPSAPLEN